MTEGELSPKERLRLAKAVNLLSAQDWEKVESRWNQLAKTWEIIKKEKEEEGGEEAKKAS